MSQVGTVSVFTLIRTDTTLDLSQKAEKVWKVPQRGSILDVFILEGLDYFYGFPPPHWATGERIIIELGDTSPILKYAQRLII